MNTYDLRKIHFANTSEIAFIFRSMTDAIASCSKYLPDARCIQVMSYNGGFRVEFLPQGVTRYIEDSWFTLTEKTNEEIEELERQGREFCENED